MTTSVKKQKAFTSSTKLSLIIKNKTHTINTAIHRPAPIPSASSGAHICIITPKEDVKKHTIEIKRKTEEKRKRQETTPTPVATPLSA